MTRRKLQPPPQQQPAAWPPGFVSKIDWRPSISRNPRTDIAEQERRATDGVGYGAGTVVMPRTPKTVRPGWLK